MKICGIKLVEKLYDTGSVCVYGQRGRGKDLLQGNVAVRQPQYISNISYGGNYIPLDVSYLNVGNGYDNFVTGDIKPYRYQYPLRTHLFFSDIGVYFPAQYNDQLNKKYGFMPTFLALSRQLTEGCSLNWNCQDLRRAWDKFREQSDIYVLCLGVFKPLLKLGIVAQKIRVYELYESAVKRVPPFRVPSPPITAKKEVKLNYEIEKERYSQTYGRVDEYLVIYRNKSTYDTYHFKHLLEGSGCFESHSPTAPSRSKRSSRARSSSRESFRVRASTVIRKLQRFVHNTKRYIFGVNDSSRE